DEHGYPARGRVRENPLLVPRLEQGDPLFFERDPEVPQRQPGPQRPGGVVLVADHEAHGTSSRLGTRARGLPASSGALGRGPTRPIRAAVIVRLAPSTDAIDVRDASPRHAREEASKCGSLPALSAPEPPLRWTRFSSQGTSPCQRRRPPSRPVRKSSSSRRSRNFFCCLRSSTAC